MNLQGKKGMPMKVSCNDLERILRDAAPQQRAALEEHAQTCAACAKELLAWDRLSLAARELHEEWDSPGLWPAIRRALAEQAVGSPKARSRWGWLTGWAGLSLGWQAAAAAALVAVLTISAVWILRPGPTHDPLAPSNALLKNDAVRDADRAEAVYVQALDKLAAQAKPQLENPSTPLLTSYREKVQMINGAIEDLRAQAGMNPSNAHLRRQLLAMYQEKQQTLEEVLEAKR
jgi:anti-sigma factor RsiW